MGRDCYYLNLALEEAKKSDVLIKVGAVLVRRGRILAVGHNHHHATRMSHIHRTCHAEMDALMRLFRNSRYYQKSHFHFERDDLVCGSSNVM